MTAAPATIQAEAILRELSDLWVTLAKPGEGEKEGAGVLRACSMTLITAVDEAEDPAGVSETLAELMHEHPSRAIVIRLRESSDPVLSARVLAQCWMPFGRRRQICCEQIELTASDASLSDLAAVVLPLTVPDLPVILWCRSARLLRLPEFPRMCAVAGKTIVDSAPFAPAILNDIATLAKCGRHVADLAWTRLTRWRELIAQIFENRCHLAGLEHVRRIRVPKSASSSTYYLAAWLLDSLEKAGIAARIVWEPEGGAAVAFESDDAGGCNVAIRAEEGSNVEVRVNDLLTHAVFAAPTDYALLREELSIPGRDPVFEASLRRAVQIL